jgi:hypothetical protein
VLPPIKTSRAYGKTPTQASDCISQEIRSGNNSEFIKTLDHSGESFKSRRCLDEWMDALSRDIWDESGREKIESLQWQLAQQLHAVRELGL